MHNFRIVNQPWNFLYEIGSKLQMLPHDQYFIFTYRGQETKGLWEETHVPKLVGLNPSIVCWMDIFHIYLL